MGQKYRLIINSCHQWPEIQRTFQNFATGSGPGKSTKMHFDFFPLLQCHAVYRLLAGARIPYPEPVSPPGIFLFQVKLHIVHFRSPDGALLHYLAGGIDQFKHKCAGLRTFELYIHGFDCRIWIDGWINQPVFIK
jgi:hypothetical protein